MLRGVTAKHRVHDDVLASHGRSSGRRNPWASDTRACVHRTPVAGCPARVADGRAGRAVEEACEARRPGRAAQRPDRAGRTVRAAKRAARAGGRSVRTAHGPGGVAGRADGAGGPGGLPAGPGRTSGPGGVTAMRVRRLCCAEEIVAVRWCLLARQTAQRVRARASWRLLAAGAARGAHGAVHRRHRAGGGGLGAWSTARTGWRLQAEELRVAALGYSRGVVKGFQGLRGAPVKTL